MKNIDCSACSDLRNNASEFTQRGVTKTVCNSLKNNTGFNPSLSTLHDNCEDLDTANDCLIGMMEAELDSYDVCDWKTFMKKFIPNLHQMIKAEICSECGQWTNLDKLRCEVNFLFRGYNFRVGEDTSGDAYAVAGKGVSFLTVSGGDAHAADLYLMYIAGGLMRGGGTYRFFNEDFEDAEAVGNFDNGTNERKSKQRKGNSVWGTVGRSANGGELICEFRIKKSAYPQLKKLYTGFGQESGGGGYHVSAIVFDGDSTDDDTPVVYAYGQHGWCDKNGNPDGTGYDGGHPVEKGWFYVQIRMTYCWQLSANGTAHYSPRYYMGVRMNQDGIDC